MKVSVDAAACVGSGRGLAHYLEGEPGEPGARDEIRTEMTRQQAHFLPG
jgi:hypothetical protein